MDRPRSHYDNLKVARNAPPEVIRAAYKALAQKFHPDRNVGDTNAANIMSIINASFEVLSDPLKRQKHDQWLIEQELKIAKEAIPSSESNSSTEISKSESQRFSLIRHILRYWLPYGVITIICWAGITSELQKNEEERINEIASLHYEEHIRLKNSVESKSSADKSSTGGNPFDQFDKPTPYNQTENRYVRPIMAPNGQPWPNSAGYIKGYPLLNADGLSTVTVDNTKNDSDVFIKLYFLNGEMPKAVRHIYIPAFSKRTLNKVTAGRYDIRYQELNTGSLARSEAFQLQEVEIYDGTQFSNITMTLYKVQNGNMEIYKLTASEF